jgi:hypothetical protein
MNSFHCSPVVEDLSSASTGIPNRSLEDPVERTIQIPMSRIQIHIEKIKEICIEIRDIKEKYKDKRHKEDEHSKTTSPKDKHSKTANSEVRLRATYKYKAGNKDRHGQHAQDHIYLRNRKHSHQKPLDDKRSNRHAYEGYPTQRLSVLTPVRPNNSHASPPSPPADTVFPSAPPFVEMTVLLADPSGASSKSSLPSLSLLSVTLQREGMELGEEL